MTVQQTQPGVYNEKLSNVNRNISGVATSITVFVGKTQRGPVNEPVTIAILADFVQTFGSISIQNTLSGAVKDFFSNGGTTAIIVRLEKNAMAASGWVPAGSGKLMLQASSKGSWGSKLKVWIDYPAKDANAATPGNTLFNLYVKEDVQGGSAESFFNVSVRQDDPRYLPKVLEQSSKLIRVLTMPSNRPDASAVDNGLIRSQPFQNKGSDGDDLDAAAYNDPSHVSDNTGLYTLNKIDLFNLLCIPPAVKGGDTDKGVFATALSICIKKRAILLVDPPASWSKMQPGELPSQLINLGLPGTTAGNAAIYFPRIVEADPEQNGQSATVVPCGFIAGIISQTDSNQGVWKSPAGITATLKGLVGLEKNLTETENGLLNSAGINCLRTFAGKGVVVWGARTLRGADIYADDFKYLAVRRLALFIEESLYRGTQWVIVENNDELLWAQIRLNVASFLHDLFMKGAFQGLTPQQAYFVKCDKETTTQSDINNGLVNILVGFAPLKPAEFVLITICQVIRHP